MFPARDLTEREQQILHAVVHTYITTAEPVGSRSIVKRFGLDLSPATVRNVMADLEEMGYLQQVHTSSGRVPTDGGYRYYVDYLMQVQELTLTERERIEQELTLRLDDADDVLKQTSHLLALVTHQAGLAEAPETNLVQVQRIELLPVGKERLAVLIVDNFGRVRSMAVQMENTVPAQDLQRMTRFLNEHLHGVSIDQLVSAVELKLRSFMDEQRLLAEKALKVLYLLPVNRPRQLFLEGATQLFEQPEFQDIGKAREVLVLLQERDRLGEMLRNAAQDNPRMQTTVIIGAQSSGAGVEGISLVAAPYRIKGQPMGMVGVLGPRRMPYPQLTAMVSFTAGMVGKILTRLGR